eukprot:SAG31_NODE_1949_length_6833_cov_4.354024_10_plen_300_part_00
MLPSLQLAWFNGDGYVSWENVWGAFNKITTRDGEALRRVSTMLRFWSARGFLRSPHWEPYAAGPIHSGVFASKWPQLNVEIGNREISTHGILWTLVNRAGKDLHGAQVVLPAVDMSDNWVYYDCYHGIELKPTLVDLYPAPPKVQLSFDLEARGYGCVAQLSSATAAKDRDLTVHLATMRALTLGRPLANYDATWKVLPQTAVRASKVAATHHPLTGTVFVPRAKNFSWKVSSVDIEGRDDLGAGEQYEWEKSPHRNHAKVFDSLGPFYIDKYPVRRTYHGTRCDHVLILSICVLRALF